MLTPRVRNVLSLYISFPYNETIKKFKKKMNSAFQEIIVFASIWNDPVHVNVFVIRIIERVEVLNLMYVYS